MASQHPNQIPFADYHLTTDLGVSAAKIHQAWPENADTQMTH